MSHPNGKWWPPNGYLSQFILDQFPPGHRGYALDVGASDGVSVNTTWALEKRHHWTVVSVEPNPVFHPYLFKERAMVEKCACGAVAHPGTSFFINKGHPESFSALTKPSHEVVRSWDDPDPWQTITVPVKTVDHILTTWDFPRLDALCVDVEGTEVDVLNGANLERWRPKVIIAESWDEEPASILRVLEPVGYRRVKPLNKVIHWRKEHPNHCFIRNGT